MISALFSISCAEKKNTNYATLYTNAKLYSEGQFTLKNFIVKDGKLSFNPNTPVNNTVNLAGKYVIPPFGSAHNHNLDRKWQLEFLPAAYLKEGTFYYQNLTSMQNRPQNYDHILHQTQH